MLRNTVISALIAAGVVLAPGAALARVGVEVWTDRGQDAVYQPGDLMQVKVRPSDDAYLLVYEIDTEGYVHVLYPYQGQNGYVEGRATVRVPDEDANVELAVEKTTGEAYIVAIASRDPFGPMPWYLRPYDPHSEGVDYVGQPTEEEGVTAEGRIVGDPFVAMERIRRRVLRAADDPESFGSAFTSYYVHDRVRYPRYLCYDCHRPGQWSWWDGFDPYYTTCSVVDFRINWGWNWGPTCWFGDVPYYCYVIRPNCDPRWRRGWNGPWYSSWDGWGRWNQMWGGSLVRYKSPPPTGYIPPNKYNDPGNWRGRDSAPPPPGFVASNRGDRYRPFVPIGHNRTSTGDGMTTPRGGTVRMPGRDVRPGDGRGTFGRPRDGRPTPIGASRGDGSSGRARPTPGYVPRNDRPTHQDHAWTPPASRGSDPAPAPRQERSPDPAPAPAPQQDSHWSPPPQPSHGDGGAHEPRGGRR